MQRRPTRSARRSWQRWTALSPDLRSFAAALREEDAALRAALRLPWNTSPVAGHITRPTLLKRQGYGRAGLDTLCGRILCTP